MEIEIQNNAGAGADGEQENQNANANGDGAENGASNAAVQGHVYPEKKEDWTNLDYIVKRKEDKIRKDYETKMQEEIAKARADAANYNANAGDGANLKEVVDDMAQDLMHYKVNDFIGANEQFSAHKTAIQEAIASNKYPGLGIEDVAILVAGKSIIATKEQVDAYKRNAPDAGSSARHIPQKTGLDPNKMSDKQILETAERSRRGETFS